MALTSTPQAHFTPTGAPEPMPPPIDPVPTFALTGDEIQAYLDQEWALSKGNPNVAMLPDAGSENAGNTENICFFLFPGSITEQNVHRHAARLQLKLERV